MSVGGTFGRERNQQQQKITYDPDKAATQADIAGQEKTFGARGAADYGTAAAGYASLAGGSGYSPAEKSAITEAGNNAERAGYAGLRDEYLRSAARTGNSAGLYGALARSQQGENESIADMARKNTIQFADEAERRKELGLAGEAGLYGENTGADLGLIGNRARLASLIRENYTHGAGTTGSVYGQYTTPLTQGGGGNT